MTDHAAEARKPASSLWAHSLEFLFASVGYVAILAILTPVRIRLMTSFLTKTQYGYLTLAVMTVSFLATLSSMGSFEYLLRKLPGQTQSQQFVLFRRIVVHFGALSIVMGIAGVLVAAMCLADDRSFGVLEVFLCAVALVLYMQLLQRSFFMLGRKQLVPFRVTQLLFSDAWFVPIIVVALGVSLTLRLILGVWVLWLMLAIGVSSVWVPWRPVWAAHRGGPSLGEILHFGAPLLPMLLGEWLFRLGDRYVLLAFTDIEKVATYTVSMNIALIIYMVILNVIGLVVPEFNRVKNQQPAQEQVLLPGNRQLRKLFSVMLRFSLAASLIGGIGLVVFRHQIMGVLCAEEFADGALILLWAAPISVFFLVQVVFSRTLIAYDRTRVVGGLTLAAAGINLVLNLVLVPVLEVRGAAMATWISMGMLMVAMGVALRAWRWWIREEVKPVRILMAVGASAIGMVGIERLLGSSSLLSLIVGGTWCGIWIVLCRLVSRDDVLLLFPHDS